MKTLESLVGLPCDGSCTIPQGTFRQETIENAARYFILFCIFVLLLVFGSAAKETVYLVEFEAGCTVIKRLQWIFILTEKACG